jgi:large subunit ribosomal protein L7/L12
MMKKVVSSGGGGGGGAAAPAAGSAAPAAAAAPAPAKEVFNIKLGEVDAKAKIKIIKEVRTITGLGLKEVCTAS